jgi:PII-like signaling protein
VGTITVDTPNAIARSFDVVDELTREHGFVTSEMVPTALAIDPDHRRGSTRMARFRY